ncbi:MAG: hypothetical protein AAF337_04160 [Pseudomonadota bacterium]
MPMSFIPETYDEWEHCITVKCGVPLTAQYIEERLAALKDPSDFHTQKFIQLWGQAHHGRTLAWFEEAGKRLAA